MTVQLVKSLCGSRLWGLASDTSDYDYRSVVVSPLSEVLLTGGKNKQTHTEDVDTTQYELNHFVRLIEGGNLTMLEILQEPVEQHPVWQTLPEGCWFSVMDSAQAHRNARGFTLGQITAAEKTEDAQRKGKYLVSGYLSMLLYHKTFQREPWEKVTGKTKDTLLAAKYGDQQTQDNLTFSLQVLANQPDLYQKRAVPGVKEWLVEKLYRELG